MHLSYQVMRKEEWLFSEKINSSNPNSGKSIPLYELVNQEWWD